VTLHRVLIHMTTDTCRHADHADIVRELTGGTAGLKASRSSLPSDAPDWWDTYRERVEHAAREAAARASQDTYSIQPRRQNPQRKLLPRRFLALAEIPEIMRDTATGRA
jgi:hypothetical protein